MINATVIEATENGLRIKAGDEESMKMLLKASIAALIGEDMSFIDIDSDDDMVVIIGGRAPGYETVIKRLGVKFPD